MARNYFHQNYPEGMSATIDPDQYRNVVELFDEKCAQFAEQPAFTCMGHTLSYRELNQQSLAFSCWLQQQSWLSPGDRIAVQLPNILQYPVVVFGAMRAGMVVVNTNPLYTEREMEHQFNDSGAKLLVIYAGMASKAEAVKEKTSIEQIIVTEIADFHAPVKKLLINSVVKYVKKLVPSYDSSKMLKLNQVLAQGARLSFTPVDIASDALAVLQYTGGTTGVAKGAELTHRNLIANMLQSYQFFKLALREAQETFVAPLPLYHIYAFTVHCLVLVETGNHNILIPNPRDIPTFIKDLKRWPFSGFAGLNTLFVALLNHPEFKNLDFSNLRLTISGGMALTQSTAERWQAVTGQAINEGYGMSETSPVVAFNPPGHVQLGTIGIPAPSTEVKIMRDDGEEATQGESGELWVRGPQVMRGYWKRPEETANTLDAEGWIKTGDIALLGEDGYLKIVDRKKDMIIVSGFNVYPNEVEDVISKHPAVIECAAIGVPSEKTGEAIKVFVVANQQVSEKELIDFARGELTAYKIPRLFEFRDALPKTNVGKILRRELRE